jgi:MFS family permease
MGRKGWIVTFAGMGLNLALGILYAWSIFGKQLTESVDKGGFGWSKTEATLPYTIAIACFAAMMVPAGRLQDKFGPRVVASVGALLTGAGLIIASFGTPATILPAVLGFGVMAGTGIGLGYASAMPAAVKWFPPQKKGLVTGLVVAGVWTRACIYRTSLQISPVDLWDQLLLQDPRNRLYHYYNPLCPVDQEPTRDAGSFKRSTRRKCCKARSCR